MVQWYKIEIWVKYMEISGIICTRISGTQFHVCMITNALNETWGVTSYINKHNTLKTNSINLGTNTNDANSGCIRKAYIYVDFLPLSGINEVSNGSERRKIPGVDERKGPFLNTDCHGSEEDFHVIRGEFGDCSGT